MSTKVIRGGRLLDIAEHAAPHCDIIIDAGRIAEIGPPGLPAPASAEVIDACHRLLHPGLVNGHTHSHGNLAKGAGARWTLEPLLTAGPWTNGSRRVEHKYLSSLIGACEMLLKGCTACYDLVVEFATPSVDGMDAVTKSCADEATLANMSAIFERWRHDRAQLRPAVASTIPYHVDRYGARQAVPA